VYIVWVTVVWDQCYKVSGKWLGISQSWRMVTLFTAAALYTLMFVLSVVFCLHALNTANLLLVLCQLEAVLSNPSTVHNIVQGSRGLAADPVALGMIWPFLSVCDRIFGTFIFPIYVLKYLVLSLCLHWLAEMVQNLLGKNVLVKNW